MKAKFCQRCRLNLPLEMFGSNRARKDGRNHYCYPCARAYHRQRRAKLQGEG